MRKTSVSVWLLWNAEPERRRWLELIYRKGISGSRREKAGTVEEKEGKSPQRMLWRLLL